MYTAILVLICFSGLFSGLTLGLLGLDKIGLEVRGRRRSTPHPHPGSPGPPPLPSASASRSLSLSLSPSAGLERRVGARSPVLMLCRAARPTGARSGPVAARHRFGRGFQSRRDPNLNFSPNQMFRRQIVMAGDDPVAQRHAERIAPVRKDGNLLLCTLLLGNVAVSAPQTALSAVRRRSPRARSNSEPRSIEQTAL